jgi:hypothetical protein
MPQALRLPGGSRYCGECANCIEFDERDDAHFDGAPGRAPMLSKAQVRAVLNLVLDQEPGGLGMVEAEVWHDAVVACARALLALPADAPSPLDE